MAKEKTVVVRRAGGRWEGIGFLLIVAGMIAAFAGQAGIGSVGMFVGFVVFLIGRFK